MAADSELSVMGQVTGGLVPYSVEQVFQMMDTLVAKAVEEGDPEIAFNAGVTLLKAEELSGKGLARLLYGLKNNWPKFKIAVPFEDVAYQYFGERLVKENINRYIRVIEQIYESQEIPEELKKQIEDRPIRDLIPIATTMASGFPIEDAQWDKLANATNNNEVLDTLRDVKGTPPRSNSTVIRMTRDGSLYVYAGGRPGEFIGYLEVSKIDENDDVKKAILRIQNSAGILCE